MSGDVNLVIQNGEEKGREISIPANGGRLGRSSKNDISLLDPELSRHHCRFFFKPDDGLWVTDLGSSNKTMLNGKEIDESAVRVDDVIRVGDTDLLVLNDSRSAPKKEKAFTSAPVIDLGLDKESKSSGKKKSLMGTLTLLLVVALIALGAAWIPKYFSQSNKTDKPLKPKEEPIKSLEIHYEKVKADTDNIFRYNLKLSVDSRLSIEIDDIRNNFHVREESKKPVDRDIIKDLVRNIENSGYFSLNEQYTGIQPGIYDYWDITVTIDKKTHRSRVTNRTQPAIFKDLAEHIEIFGRNELGLWAVQYSAEELTKMAYDAFILGQKLFDEREIDYGNLAKAINSFKAVELDVRSIEPKPEFYAEALTSLSECKTMLQEKYSELNFMAERASNLKDWDKAVKYLRIICETVPDRSDERNQQARKKLLEAERRLKALK